MIQAYHANSIANDIKNRLKTAREITSQTNTIEKLIIDAAGKGETQILYRPLIKEEALANLMAAGYIVEETVINLHTPATAIKFENVAPLQPR